MSPNHAFSLARPLLASAILALAASLPAGWQPTGTLNVPQYPYSFLASAPNGDLLATTHNFDPRSAGAQGKLTGAAQDMPALLIKNPTSSTPQVVELLRTKFDIERGYAGIACDMTGALYVSGDSGEVTRSFLAKFDSSGRPVTSFGVNGTIRPQRRCLGVETAGPYVLLAVDWGIVQVYDALTGRAIGRLPQQVKNLYMRDITVDPRSLRVFGVAQGGVVTWGNSAPWNPSGYDFRVFSPPLGRSAAGEGISLDPFQRCLLVIPYPGQTLYEIFGNRTAVQTKISTAAADAQLVDTTVSFDGKSLFVSDVTDRKIHVLKRVESDVAAPAQHVPIPVAGAAAAPTGLANPVTWYQSYDLIVRTARENKLPMLLYFRGANPACSALEKGILQSPEFYTAAGKTICVWSDAEKNRLLAYKFGVIRAPHLIILDPMGGQIAQFAGTVPKEELLAALRSVRR